MKKNKTAKLQDFKEDNRIKNIQKYANGNCNGNFTEAVNDLCDAGLKARQKQKK